MTAVPDRRIDTLVAMVVADPDDQEAQLVLADQLIAEGDPRGELIVLDHRDRTTEGGLREPVALERLLLLAAEYTFPRARDVLEPPLPFEGGGAYPVQYAVTYEGLEYFIRYRHGDLSIDIENRESTTGVGYPEGYPWGVHDKLCFEGEWTDEETVQMLAVFGDAIRAGSPLAELQFPFMTEALPVYPAGPIRCYRLPLAFTSPRGIAPTRYGLAARDYHRWHGLWHRLPR